MVVTVKSSRPAHSGSKAATKQTSVLHRSIAEGDHLPRLVGGKGNLLDTDDGRQIFDASGGAAVACIGHGNERVRNAVAKQMAEISYCCSSFYTNSAYEELSRLLIESTYGHMTRAYIVNSGSEAMEAAMKLARQYFLEKSPAQPQRTKFIARRQSYHGTTIGSLSMGGHKARRAKFESMLMANVSHVSPCYSYRCQGDDSDQKYVERLAKELDAEFERLGPDTVCAFVAEPFVGAALACVGSVPGYFESMKAVCRKYGALLIMDEVMSGMGRTGTMHAWEQVGVAPDLQTIGKCLGGGYQPVAGLLVSKEVAETLEHGTGVFMHGHTYQGHAVACAAALEVQRIIREQNLIANCRQMGELLGALLFEKLAGHPNVGNIRGKGMFWGIEFVHDKTTKEPFPPSAGVAVGLAEKGLEKPYCIGVYPGNGTVDGVAGDHIVIAPAYNLIKSDVEWIVNTLSCLVTDYFRTSVK